MSADEINSALTGCTELVRFDLSAGLNGKPPFQLVLTVAHRAGRRVTLVCEDVQNLELNPNGDAFDRLPELHVEDLRQDGLERIHFSLEELQRDTLFLHCAGIRLEQA